MHVLCLFLSFYSGHFGGKRITRRIFRVVFLHSSTLQERLCWVFVCECGRGLPSKRRSSPSGSSLKYLSYITTRREHHCVRSRTNMCSYLVVTPSPYSLMEQTGPVPEANSSYSYSTPNITIPHETARPHLHQPRSKNLRPADRVNHSFKNRR